MSRIDELQRLHEAATASQSANSPYFWMSQPRADSMQALHNSWPAIHRVLLAARKVTGDGGLLFIYELEEDLRALDGDKGAT